MSACIHASTFGHTAVIGKVECCVTELQFVCGFTKAVGVFLMCDWIYETLHIVLPQHIIGNYK